MMVAGGGNCFSLILGNIATIAGMPKKIRRMIRLRHPTAVLNSELMIPIKSVGRKLFLLIESAFFQACQGEKFFKTISRSA